MRAETERKMKRWREQRWILDQVIQTRGIDWDQGRSGKLLRNCGAGVESDVREIGRRVQKFTDIQREFSRAAERREELAREAEAAGHEVEAREHYYVAAAFYANAMWPIYEDNNPRRIAWGEKKRACYDKFIRFAGRPIERVELAYEGKSIAALLHLPPGLKAGEKVPCVLYIPGMDGVKEDNPLHGDPFIERGIAVLAVDGPARARHPMHRVELRRRGQARRRLSIQAARDRRQPPGDHGLEHGIVLGAARGRGRAALQGLRRERRLRRARPVHDLQHRLADF